LRDPFAARRYAGYSAVWQLFACLSVCLSACSPVWLYCVVSVKLPKRKESSIFYCNICAHHATTEWGGGLRRPATGIIHGGGGGGRGGNDKAAFSQIISDFINSPTIAARFRDIGACEDGRRRRMGGCVTLWHAPADQATIIVILIHARPHRASPQRVIFLYI